MEHKGISKMFPTESFSAESKPALSEKCYFHYGDESKLTTFFVSLTYQQLGTAITKNAKPFMSSSTSAKVQIESFIRRLKPVVTEVSTFKKSDNSKVLAIVFLVFSRYHEFEATKEVNVF